jgi:DNA-binding response OmpR family regulator
MTSTWRSAVNGLRERTGSLWRRWEQFTSARRTVLAVTKDIRCRTNLRIYSLEQGWRILFAESLEDALRLQYLGRICVLVYDCDLPGIDWRRGLRTLLAVNDPLVPIVISSLPNSRFRSEVLNFGGYDVARNPLEPERFVPLVNGALALAGSIDSLEF